MSTQVLNNNDLQDWPLSNEEIKAKLEVLKKNEKMSRINIMILRTLLFSFIGQLISFLTLTQHYISKSGVETKNPTIMMILLFFQFLIMTLLMIIFQMKIKRPKFAYLLISLLYVANISLDLFAYKQDSSNHMLIVFMWSLIALSIYACIVSKGKFSLNQLLGFVLSTIGIIMMLSFILYSIYNSDLLFFNDGFLNNLVAIIHGMAFAAAIVLQELFLKNEEEIYNGLMWIGLSTCGFIAIITLIIGDFSAILNYFNRIDANNILKSSSVVILGVIIHTITPFYINKCSSLVFCLSLGAQLYWKFVIDMIFFEYNITLLWNTFGVIILLIGIGFYLFDQFKTKRSSIVKGPLFDSLCDISSYKQNMPLYNNEIKDIETKEKLIEDEIENSNDNIDEVDKSNEITGREKKKTQKLFVDTGDKISECSAFSFPSRNGSLIK